MTIWRTFSGAVAILGSVHSVYAGPDATAKFLMDDPVSVMDFGLYKMEQDLRDICSGGRCTLSVSYDPGANRIVVNLTDLNGDFKARSAAVAACKDYIFTIRSRLCINPNSGKPQPHDHSCVPDFFQHSQAGFERKSQPKALDRDIDNLVQMKVTVKIYALQSSNFKTVKCQAPLLGKGTLVSE